MVELPTGTVTLLFTDIEGSTRMLRSLGDDYGAVPRVRAGHDGGRIVFSGTPADLVADADTLTARHLRAYLES